MQEKKEDETEASWVGAWKNKKTGHIRHNRKPRSSYGTVSRVLPFLRRVSLSRHTLPLCILFKGSSFSGVVVGVKEQMERLGLFNTQSHDRQLLVQ